MMRHVFFLLLVLMLASAFHKKQKPTPKPYRQFGNFSMKHIVKKRMHVNECFNMLKTKKINKEGMKCKPINTFILADVEDVVDVCKNGIQNNPEEGMYESHGRFKMTVCRVTEKDNRFPKCKYKGEVKEAKIKIKCSNVGLPVHFHDEADDDDFGELLWF